MTRSARRLLLIIACSISLATWLPSALGARPGDRATIRVASKHFTEGYILTELMAQLLEARGYQVQRFHGLGGTMVCFRALAHGEIDLYPEYSGTIEQEILQSPVPLREEELRHQMRERFNLAVLPSFGFNNTYAIALPKTRAGVLRLSTISDLRQHPELTGGVSYEFLKRQDGWPALAKAYHLPHQPVGLEHGLAYEALRAGQIDFTDAYTTDAKIEKFGLVILEDDQRFFPQYLAVPLVRDAVAQELAPTLALLARCLDEATMRQLNARVELEQVPFAEVARQFLVRKGLVADTGRPPWAGLAARLAHRTLEHVGLTTVALVAAVAVAVPLGIAAYRTPALGSAIIPIAGLLQTIPSIAFLAMLIPICGIGKWPAIVALFTYGLLPIVRNTYAGLNHVDPQYRLIAQAMGLTAWQRVKVVELPLSFPIILAGVKTAAIINIGTATLAAFIGAGGLGEPIVTGLALNDRGLILEGAIPAALLALLTEGAFRLIDRSPWADDAPESRGARAP